MYHMKEASTTRHGCALHTIMSCSSDTPVRQYYMRQYSTSVAGQGRLDAPSSMYSVRILRSSDPARRGCAGYPVLCTQSVTLKLQFAPERDVIVVSYRHRLHESMVLTRYHVRFQVTKKDLRKYELDGMQKPMWHYHVHYMVRMCSGLFNPLCRGEACRLRARSWAVHTASHGMSGVPVRHPCASASIIGSITRPNSCSQSKLIVQGWNKKYDEWVEEIGCRSNNPDQEPLQNNKRQKLSVGKPTDAGRPQVCYHASVL